MIGLSLEDDHVQVSPAGPGGCGPPPALDASAGSRWLLATVAVALAVLSGPAPARAAEDSPASDCHRVESQRFVFHSDPWINLHHFLFQWARNADPRLPGDRRRPVEVVELDQLEDLSEVDRRAWERAVGHYRDHLVAGDLLFGRDLVALRGRLGALACTATGAEDIEPALRSVLDEAMGVYRLRWWPEHDALNRSWIRDRQRGLERHGIPLARGLAEAYGGEWPSGRIRVDVTVYANWAGAYTTNGPDQVTVSSRDYGGLEGLEILFHEVSHASFFEQRLLGHLAAAFRRQEAERPDRIGHVIQFMTPAEILRSLLSEEERQDVRFVADAMAERRRSREHYRIVREHWVPFLEGKIQRDVALDGIAGEFVR